MSMKPDACALRIQILNLVNSFYLELIVNVLFTKGTLVFKSIFSILRNRLVHKLIKQDITSIVLGVNP